MDGGLSSTIKGWVGGLQFNPLVQLAAAGGIGVLVILPAHGAAEEAAERHADQDPEGGGENGEQHHRRDGRPGNVLPHRHQEQHRDRQLHARARVFGVIAGGGGVE